MAGQILIGGEDMTEVDAEASRHRHGLPELRAVSAHERAFDNIASTADGARPANRPRRSDAGVQKVAKLLKIDHVLTHHPKALSNGQKQRTALARALAGNRRRCCCSMIPCAMSMRNCASRCVSSCRACSPRKARRSIYVTQDYKEAMALGERIAVMDAAAASCQIGTPEDIYLAPANADIEIARLFGDPTINLLDVDAAGGWS